MNKELAKVAKDVLDIETFSDDTEVFYLTDILIALNAAHSCGEVCHKHSVEKECPLCIKEVERNII